MSISSVKYFEIKIFTNNDFTDPYLLKLIKKKPGLNEYVSLIQDLNISSHNSKTILEFISNYDNFFFYLINVIQQNQLGTNLKLKT